MKPNLIDFIAYRDDVIKAKARLKWYDFKMKKDYAKDLRYYQKEINRLWDKRIL